jgi:demethylmenaquinone methyltransferase/2-methoxy-6-polyprenyl-1,4-benzoquinol methylase
MTPGQVPLRDAFTSPDTKKHYVRRLFSTIADRYDLITVLLSYGMDRRWKRRVGAFAAVRRGARVLDLACGTGDIARELQVRGASVIGLDVTERMLLLARRKTQGIGLVCADMASLPFGSAEFDIITTGYGLRNVPDLPVALAEAHRVLRPGGRLVSLDFNRPRSGLVRAIYLGYLTAVGAALGWILHRDPDTYRYIPASIQRYPGADGVAAMMRAAGFTEARWTAVLGGLMAIHVAEK